MHQTMIISSVFCMGQYYHGTYCGKKARAQFLHIAGWQHSVASGAVARIMLWVGWQQLLEGKVVGGGEEG